MIYYMRAAYPYESGANEIAKKSLLLSVQPKKFMSAALKIAKLGGQKKKTFKVIFITFSYYYFFNYVFLSGQQKCLEFFPV